MSFTSYQDLFKLTDIVFVAGTDFELKVYIVDQTGNPVVLTGSTCSLKVSPFGNPGGTLFTLSGIISVSPTNLVAFYFIPSNTSGLSGKYIYQPIITDTVPKTYSPGTGVLTLGAGLS